MLTYDEFLELENIIEKEEKNCLDSKRVLNDLTDKGYLKNGEITRSGLEIMEPYRVKRAVIMAAGFGERMKPITINTPKSLVRVHGKRLIETTLDAILEVGIKEIYIVRGHLGEQFDELKSKYPTIQLIDNPTYNKANSIYSALFSQEYLHDAYILDGDLYLKNKRLIRKYQYSSNYLGILVEKTEDWCFITDDQLTIKKIAFGGTNCYSWVGISYWNYLDGKKMVSHIEETLKQPDGKSKFWDAIALEAFKDEFSLKVRECSLDDIIEIDSFHELMEIDSTYAIK